MEVDGSFRVNGFKEKPADPRPLPTDPSRALVTMGIYVFKKSILVASLRAFCESGGGYDFGHDVIPGLIHSARTYAYDFRKENEIASPYWRDIGTIDAYYKSSKDLVQDDPPFDPYFNGQHPALPHVTPPPRTRCAPAFILMPVLRSPCSRLMCKSRPALRSTSPCYCQVYVSAKVPEYGVRSWKKESKYLQVFMSVLIWSTTAGITR